MCLAVPGRIVSLVTGEDTMLREGRVDFGGVIKSVSLACTPEAAIGDFVLVHAGLAITTVDAGEARRVFEYLREIEALEPAAGGKPA